MENRHKNFLYSLLPTVMMLSLQMLVIIFLSEIAMVKVTYEFDGSTFNEYMEDIFAAMSGVDFTVFASFLFSLVACAVFLVWYHNLRQQKSLNFKANLDEATEKIKEAKEEAKGVFLGCKWTMIPGIIVFVIGLEFALNFLLEFLGRMFPEWLALYDQILKASGLEDANLSWPIILYAAIFGPITEELAYRGVTFTYARRSMPLWAANAVQAVLFAGMHMNPLQSAYALIFGLLLGYIYGKSRNIVITIIMHVCFNTASLFLSDLIYTGDDPISYFLILLTSLMATYFGFILILRSLPITVKVNPGDEY